MFSVLWHLSNVHWSSEVALGFAIDRYWLGTLIGYWCTQLPQLQGPCPALGFQRQLKASCQLEHSALLWWRAFEEVWSDLKHAVLRTLWLLAAERPRPHLRWHVLLSLLICFIWKISPSIIHIPKQQQEQIPVVSTRQQTWKKRTSLTSKPK